jgi:hypothetical protein
MGDKITEASSSDIFGSNKLITRVEYYKDTLLTRYAEDDITQTYFLQDTNEGMYLAMYYDSFFGTFAFVKLLPGMGRPVEAQVASLPKIVWTTKAVPNATIDEPLPQDLAASLKQLKAVRLESAASDDYIVSAGTEKGLPPKVVLDPKQWRLTGEFPTTRSGAALALVYALNSEKQRVALLWIKTQPTK